MKVLAAPVVLVFLFVGWMLFVGLRSADGFEEVARVPSVDGALDAVVVESNGGATTPFGYRVCVVPAGQPCEPDDAVLTAVGAFHGGERGVGLRWSGEDRLRVDLVATRWALREPEVHVSGRTVRLSANS